MGDIDEYKDTLKFRSMMEEFYDFENEEITDEVLRKSKFQALEYVNNKLKTNLNKHKQ